MKYYLKIGYKVIKYVALDFLFILTSLFKNYQYLITIGTTDKATARNN